MQFNKNTSSGRTNIIAIIIKFIISLAVILGLVFFINKIDFPAPKKEIEKTIPNENYLFYRSFKSECSSMTLEVPHQNIFDNILQ